MNFDLDRKVAIVTGGAGILGTVFCRGLLQSGARVVVADLDDQKATTLAQELDTEHGGRIMAVQCDVSDPASVARLVGQAVDRFGSIDVLVNNAASKSDDLSQFFAPFEEYQLAEWRKVMAVNLDGVFLVTQAVGNQMLRQGRGGSVIQISSIYGVMASDPRIYKDSSYEGRPINNPAVYSASKAGVVGFTRWLATHWAEKGIRVNAIAPGGVESGQNATFQRNYSARVPMGRMARRDEMVGIIVYLASDASSYVTGQCFSIDGGLSAW